MDYCQLTTCDDLALMEGFLCGLEDDIRFIMPRADPCWSLKNYINFALWIAGSAFTVDKAEPSSQDCRPPQICASGNTSSLRWAVLEPRSSHVVITPLSVPAAVPQLSFESTTAAVSSPEPSSSAKSSLSSAADPNPPPSTGNSSLLPSAAPKSCLPPSVALSSLPFIGKSSLPPSVDLKSSPPSSAYSSPPPFAGKSSPPPSASLSRLPSAANLCLW